MTHRKTDTDLISASLDGELSWTERLQVLVKSRTQPGFRRQLNQHRELQARYRKQMQRIDETPLPDSLQQLLGTTKQPPTDTSVPWKARVQQAMESFSWQPATAFALSLVLVTALIVVRPDGNPRTLLSELEQTIQDEQLSQTLSGSSFVSELGSVEVVLAFKTAPGEVCKLVNVSGTTSAQSVFCQQGNSWTTVVAEPVSHSITGSYQLADDGLADPVAAFINTNMLGGVMSREEEAALR